MDPRNALALLLFSMVILRPNFAAASRHLMPHNADEFVRSTCQVNRFPDVCIKLLKPFGGSFGGDVGKMALKAIEIALGKVQETSEYLSKLQTPPGTNQELVNLVTAAKSVVKDGVGDQKDALMEMKKLVPKPNMAEEDFKAAVKHVQWDVVTTENNIGDFFDEFKAPESPMKADVTVRLNDVMQYASVPVGLLTSYMGDA